ncbi:pyridoxamine 5'-phosphate oxidase family protein [Ornithinimicrobium sp. F0845]|uniref:pyridoxamine 5'-phosphate oxidase family protein n=1 Tax=Ornithinimicrobium sp. F0845 TaxID=2926412 RepID=UPI001FF639EB|nr:pyridoxamine 5'-phosphate oxidase family protein [Ornithinimicrobium sp. F0845]MCK0112002.1 pyridoxamine 5'-phosphate oxidase family protein [Ornithinimicrobium sp. F0845]
MSAHPGTEVLDTATCLALLREAAFGRLAVIVNGRPEIYPVNHAVHHGSVVFRTGRGSKLAGAVGQAVAYEVDGVDEATGQAWSVVVAGHAHEVQQLHDILEALDLPVFPWEEGPKPHFVRIDPDGITGRRFVIHGGKQGAGAGLAGETEGSD